MRTRILLLFFPVLLLLASCQKTANTVSPNQTVLISITSTKWTTADGGKTYSAFISMSAIDNAMNAYGAVLVYASFDGGASYEQVPEVYGGIAYSFIYSVGHLEVDIQAATGSNVITPPGNVNLKIVLIPSTQ